MICTVTAGELGNVEFGNETKPLREVDVSAGE
jgi:hypothetical protein